MPLVLDRSKFLTGPTMPPLVPLLGEQVVDPAWHLVTPSTLKPRPRAIYEVWLEGSAHVLMDPMNKKTRENLRKGINEPPDRDAKPIDICRNKLYGREDGDPKAQVIVPARCLYSCNVEGGRKVPNRRVKGKASNISTATSTTLPGIMQFLDEKWEFFNPTTGEVIHEPEWVIDECRGVGNQTKTAVCITRPRIPVWFIRGRIAVFLEEVTPQDVCKLLIYSGRKIGVGSYRPQKKGPYGTFEVIGMYWVGGDKPDTVPANREANPPSVARDKAEEVYEEGDENNDEEGEE